MGGAQVVESKGVICEEAVDAALRGTQEFGHRGKVMLKADGENAVKALKEEVLAAWTGGGSPLNRLRTNTNRTAAWRTA